MAHFTINFGSTGPLAEVLVGLPHDQLLALTRRGEGSPPSLRLRALVDTGASNTLVDASLLRRLRLARSGRALVSTAVGSTALPTETFDISLILVHPRDFDSSLTLPELRVSAVDLSGETFQVLLGRDILKHCVLTYNGGQGWLTIAY